MDYQGKPADSKQIVINIGAPSTGDTDRALDQTVGGPANRPRFLSGDTNNSQDPGGGRLITQQEINDFFSQHGLTGHSSNNDSVAPSLPPTQIGGAGGLSAAEQTLDRPQSTTSVMTIPAEESSSGQANPVNVIITPGLSRDVSPESVQQFGGKIKKAGSFWTKPTFFFGHFPPPASSQTGGQHPVTTYQFPTSWFSPQFQEQHKAWAYPYIGWHQLDTSQIGGGPGKSDTGSGDEGTESSEMGSDKAETAAASSSQGESSSSASPSTGSSRSGSSSEDSEESSGSSESAESANRIMEGAKVQIWGDDRYLGAVGIIDQVNTADGTYRVIFESGSPFEGDQVTLKAVDFTVLESPSSKDADSTSGELASSQLESMEEEAAVEDMEEAGEEEFNLQTAEVGDHVTLKMIDTQDPLDEKELIIIYYGPEELRLYDPLEQRLLDYELDQYEVPKKYKIAGIQLIERTPAPGYLALQDLEVNCRVKIVSVPSSAGSTYHNREGVLISVLNGMITIEFEEKPSKKESRSDSASSDESKSLNPPTTSLEIDLSNGLSKTTGIEKILKIGDAPVKLDDEGVVFLEELGEIEEVLEIPEEERSFTTAQMFDGLFHQLRSIFPYRGPNGISDEQLKKLVNQLILSSQQATLYSSDGVRVLGAKPVISFNPLIKSLLAHQYPNQSFIPLVYEKKKIYVDSGGIEETISESVINVNFTKQLFEIHQIQEKYQNNALEGNPYDTLLNMLFSEVQPNVIDTDLTRLGYNNYGTQDSIMARFCSQAHPCLFYSEPAGGIRELSFRQLRAPGPVYRPFDIEATGDTSKQLAVEGCHNKIVGFISFPSQEVSNINVGEFPLKTLLALSSSTPLLFQIVKKTPNITLSQKSGSTVTAIIREPTTGQMFEVEGEVITDPSESAPIQEQAIIQLRPTDPQLREVSDTWPVSEKYVTTYRKGESVLCWVNTGGQWISFSGVIQGFSIGGEGSGEPQEGSEEGLLVEVLPNDEQLQATQWNIPVDLIHPVPVLSGSGDISLEDLEKSVVWHPIQTEQELVNSSYYFTLRDLLPSTRQLIFQYSSWMSQVVNLDQIRRVLTKYQVKVPDLSYSQALPFYQVLAENNKKVRQQSYPIQEQTKQLFQDYPKLQAQLQKKYAGRDFTFIPNQSLKTRKSIELYGVYPYFDSRYDSDIVRYWWLVAHADHGSTYLKQRYLEFENVYRQKLNIEEQQQGIRKDLDEAVLQLQRLVEQQQAESQDTASQEQQGKCVGNRIAKVYTNQDALRKDNMIAQIPYDPNLDPTPLQYLLQIQSQYGKLSPAELERELSGLLRGEGYSPAEIPLIVTDIMQGSRHVKPGDYALLRTNDRTQLWKRIKPPEEEFGMWVLQRHNDAVDIPSLCNQQGIGLSKLAISDLQSDLACVYKQPSGPCLPRKEEQALRRIEQQQGLVNGLREELLHLEGFNRRLLLIQNEIINSQAQLQQTIRYQAYSNMLREEQHQLIVQRYDDIKAKTSKALRLIQKALSHPDHYQRHRLLEIVMNGPYLRRAIPPEDVHWFYTVDTDQKALCLHWTLKVLMTRNLSNAAQYLEQMIEEYGTYDLGSAYIVCKYDGDPLAPVADDTLEGFEEGGAIINTRAILLRDEDEIYRRDSQVLGLEKGSVQDRVFGIFSGMLKSIAITLDPLEQLKIVNDVTSFIQEEMTSPEKWKLKEKQKWMAPAKKKRKIDPKKLSDPLYLQEIQKKLDAEYESYWHQSVLTFIAARLLMTLQTIIPSIIPKEAFSGCTFYLQGYPLDLEEIDSKEEATGINFMACVLRQLSQSQPPWSYLSKMSKEKLRKILKQELGLWYTKNGKIQNAYQEKRQYQESIRQQIEDLRDYQLWISFRPSLQGLYRNIPTGSEGSYTLASIERRYREYQGRDNQSQLTRLRQDTVQQLTNLSQSWFNTVNDIIRQEAPFHKSILQIANTQNSCCFQNIIPDFDYLAFFIEKQGVVRSLATRLRELDAFYHQQFAPIDTLMVLPQLISDDPLATQDLQQVVPSEIPSDDIYLLYLTFSDEERTLGQRRLFNQFGRCVISGQVSEAYAPSLTVDNRITILRESVVYGQEDYRQFLLRVNQSTLQNFPIPKEVLDNIKLLGHLESTFLNSEGKITALLDSLKEVTVTGDGSAESPHQINQELEKLWRRFGTSLDEQRNLFITSITAILTLDTEAKGNWEQFSEGIGSYRQMFKEARGPQDVNDLKYIWQISLIKKYLFNYFLPMMVEVVTQHKSILPPPIKSWQITPYIADKLMELAEIQVQQLEPYYHNAGLKAVFSRAIKVLSQLRQWVKQLQSKSLISDAQGNIHQLSLFRPSDTVILMKYIFFKFLNYLLAGAPDFAPPEGGSPPSFEEKEEGTAADSSIAQQVAAEIATSQDEVVPESTADLEQELSVEDAPIFSQQEDNSSVIARFINTVKERITQDTQSQDLSPQQIVTEVEQHREREKERFIHRIDQMTDENRAVDQVMKHLKIGDLWSKGIAGGDIKDDEDQFEQQKEQDRAETALQSQLEGVSEDQVEVARIDQQLEQRLAAEEGENFQFADPGEEDVAAAVDEGHLDYGDLADLNTD